MAIKVGMEYGEVELTFAVTGSGTGLKQEDTEFTPSLGGGTITTTLEVDLGGEGFVPAVMQAADMLNEFSTSSKKISLEEG